MPIDLWTAVPCNACGSSPTVCTRTPSRIQVCLSCMQTRVDFACRMLAEGIYNWDAALEKWDKEHRASAKGPALSTGPESV